MWRPAIAGSLLLVIGACMPQGSPAPTPSTESPTTVPTAVPVEQAASVLVLDLGSGPDRPGLSAAAPGGITPKGPTSFAVDDDWIYVWDQANQRLLLYELHPFATTRQPPPVIALPSVPSAATGLLVKSPDEWYLRTVRDDGAIDQQFHAVIREAARGAVVSSASGDPSIYPRERFLQRIIGPPKGQPESLGRDVLGNRYERVTIPSGARPDESDEFRRVRESDGSIVAVDRRPSARPQDTYVSERGGVYELRWDDAVPPRRAEITQILAPIPRPTACPGLVEAALPPTGATRRWPAATAADVRAGLGTDPDFRHLLEDLAGVRQDSNPLRDAGVPRCAVDTMTIGEPVFVRSYPSNTGVWYVPVLYQRRQLLLATVGRNADGLGALGGARGGGDLFPSMNAATALRIATAPNDPAVSAELVAARSRLLRSCLVAWRAVRASGAAVYVFPDFPGSAADGLLAAEADVELGSC